MSGDSVKRVNAECINMLIRYEKNRISKDVECVFKIVTDNLKIKGLMKRIDNIVENIYVLMDNKNYKKALLFACILHAEVDKLCNQKNGETF